MSALSVSGAISLVVFLAATFFWLRHVPPENAVSRLIAALLILPAQLVVTGQILGQLNRLADPSFWLYSAIFLLLVAYLSAKKSAQNKGGGKPAISELKTLGSELGGSSLFTKIIFYVLAGTLLAVLCLNILSICTCAPNNWDSMAYHLARVAYYLQFGNLENYGANYWAQDVHAHNASILLAYVLGILGTEVFTQAVQFIAYLGAGLVVYGLARELRCSRPSATIAMMVFLLLIENVMESITPQNDLILIFFSGAAVYYIIVYAKERKLIYLMLAGGGIALAVGTKVSFLMHLPVWLIFFIYLLRSKRELNGTAKNTSFVKIALYPVVFLLMLVILGDGPGYWNNYTDYGHPFGPDGVRSKHSFAGKPLSEVAIEGSKNLLRYGFDFVSLDGLNHVPGVTKKEFYLKRDVLDFLQKLGVNLEVGEMVAPFRPTTPYSDEDFSWWGVFGFMLLPAGLLAAAFRVRKGNRLIALLLLSGGVFIIGQAYISPYDPWRGRYFGFLTLLWGPFIALLLLAKVTNNRLLQVYVVIVVLLGCLSGILAVVLRDFRPITMGFKTTRLEQLTAVSRSLFLMPLSNFERVVPGDAVVIVFLPPNTYEYPFFGKGLTRKLIPVRGLQRFEFRFGEPEYLVYRNTEEMQLSPVKSDLHLGNGFFLRKLKE
ncbi:MAG: phospholipid carrier-dependent glycosyltransferase [Planctomycetota bacterium]|jgi:4-amino-4-deoxy-L-arabinose transferase-like glycosyltransferase